jgi:hypothetical protein
LTGVWEEEAPGSCRASVDELHVLCNKAFNESLTVGVSVYHIERDGSGVGFPGPHKLVGGWGKADTEVTNEASLVRMLPSSPWPDHSVEEWSENWDMTSGSWADFVPFQGAIFCITPTSIQADTSVTQSRAVTIR